MQQNDPWETQESIIFAPSGHLLLLSYLVMSQHAE